MSASLECRALIGVAGDIAGVAQLVEQLICNQPVGGSIPLASSKSPRNAMRL